MSVIVKKTVPIAIFLSLVALNACEPADQQPAPPPDEQIVPTNRPIMPADKIKDIGEGENRYLLLVYVRMIIVSVPPGTVSGSETLWSYLDEERVSPLRSASLGRNGLRAGVARRDSWPDLEKMLEQATGRQLKMTTLISQPGEPVAIVMKQRQPVQTIFVYSDEKTLSGRDYPAGDNLLSLYCTLNAEDPSKIMITAVPQIRSTAQRPQFVTGEGLPRLASLPDYYSFDAATFQAMLPSRDVLVLGPGSHSARRSSIAHMLLTREIEGVEHETVLILIPEVFATPIR